MSLPPFINKDCQSFFVMENTALDHETAYLNSIVTSNGLSPLTCSLYKEKDIKCQKQSSNHLENLIHMIDLNSESYEAAIEENYSK